MSDPKQDPSDNGNDRIPGSGAPASGKPSPSLAPVPSEAADPTLLPPVGAHQIGAPPIVPPGIQNHPFPGLPAGFAGVGLSVTNPAVEVSKRVTAEHISQELKNNHDRAMRIFQVQEQEIANEERERIREHDRDKRDRDEQERGDARLERLFYVVFGAVVLLVGVLIYKDKVELALKAGGGFVGVLALILSGVGVEKLRQSRAARRLKPPTPPDE